jgi:hypothetical protein
VCVWGGGGVVCLFNVCLILFTVFLRLCVCVDALTDQNILRLLRFILAVSRYANNRLTSIEMPLLETSGGIYFYSNYYVQSTNFQSLVNVNGSFTLNRMCVAPCRPLLALLLLIAASRTQSRARAHTHTHTHTHAHTHTRFHQLLLSTTSPVARNAR